MKERPEGNRGRARTRLESQQCIKNLVTIFIDFIGITFVWKGDYFTGRNASPNIERSFEMAEGLRGNRGR